MIAPAIDGSSVDGRALINHARACDSIGLCNTLKDDFIHALNEMVKSGTAPAERRAVVRCFGSLIEGLASAMTTIAVDTCEFHRTDFNRFLHAKTNERGLATYNRIFASYTVVREFLPHSPLGHVPGKRWDALHRAMEIRNRILHPKASCDLELTNQEMTIIAHTGGQFARDFAVFLEWSSQKQQRLIWEGMAQRRRLLPKTGRNDKCPCGSQRKYKNCCAAAQYAA
ncbi:MAG: SEC-C metal-binding domain-containing protein [Verrucomicrobiota bacterium]|nr:SEC-C metal-binding domain-containing protein [Verrucomicrobiota bacterium]